MSAITTLVQIADKFGHTSAMMTREETLEAIEDNEGSWVFNGSGQMVQPQQLAETDWDTVGTVRIVPGLVGGEDDTPFVTELRKSPVGRLTGAKKE